MSDTDRFWSRVDKSGDCWEWTGSRRSFGYGNFYADGRNVAAHRVSWDIHYGPIPEGMFVLHRCDNPPCVRPDHLWLGTNADNTRDRDEKRRQANSRKTECKHGHPLTPDNVYVRPDSGHRNCRICFREKDARRRVRNRRWPCSSMNPHRECHAANDRLGEWKCSLTPPEPPVSQEADRE